MIAIKVEGQREMEAAFRKSPQLLASGARNGIHRGFNGFRNTFKRQLQPRKLASKKLNYLWWVDVTGTELDDIQGRFGPKNFNPRVPFDKGLLSFETGKAYGARRSTAMAIPVPWKRYKGGKTDSGRSRRGKSKPGYGSPAEFRKTFKRRRLVPRRSGSKLYLVEFVKQRGKWVSKGPAFIITRRAKPRKRLGLQKTWSDAGNRRAFVDRVNKGIVKYLNQQLGKGAAKVVS